MHQAKEVYLIKAQIAHGDGGRKGSRNKVSEKLLEALALDFDTHVCVR
jgi:hypothetical protein